MPKTDRRVDAYIAKSASFAQPILNHVRDLVHKAVPDVEETIKWGFPNFEHHGVMCSIAAFKEHCAFGFWKASLMSDPAKVLGERREKAMGHFGRIGNLKDLPPDKVLIAYLKEAAQLNEDGVKAPPRKKAAKKELSVPGYLTAALKKNKKALAAFEEFSPSHRREYVAWLEEAKTDETRTKRLTTAIEWIAKGKSRNWKYERA